MLLSSIGDIGQLARKIWPGLHCRSLTSSIQFTLTGTIKLLLSLSMQQHYTGVLHHFMALKLLISYSHLSYKYLYVHACINPIHHTSHIYIIYVPNTHLSILSKQKYITSIKTKHLYHLNPSSEGKLTVLVVTLVPLEICPLNRNLKFHLHLLFNKITTLQDTFL
jgi:hypothetical protein